MNRVLFVVVLIGALWGIDTYALHGRYSNAVWEETNYQARIFNDGVRSFVRKIGP
jgi:hypothetical protein